MHVCLYCHFKGRQLLTTGSGFLVFVSPSVGTSVKKEFAPSLSESFSLEVIPCLTGIKILLDRIMSHVAEYIFFNSFTLIPLNDTSALL